jgi:hypothetical protein
MACAEKEDTNSFVEKAICDCITQHCHILLTSSPKYVLLGHSWKFLVNEN